MGFTRQTRHGQSVGNARPQIPPVKSVRKLLAIELPAGATAPVKGPVHLGFGVANDDIDSMEHHLGLRICAERHLLLRMMLLGCTDIDRGAVRRPHPVRFHPSFQYRFHGLVLEVRHRL